MGMTLVVLPASAHGERTFYLMVTSTYRYCWEFRRETIVIRILLDALVCLCLVCAIFSSALVALLFMATALYVGSPARYGGHWWLRHMGPGRNWAIPAFLAFLVDKPQIGPGSWLGQ